jgi:hypothetical protein
VGVITGAVSVLGGALSFLLSPIGLIGAAFVAAGLLIWRYWEPIKAFFSGFFTGVWQALTPVRAAFSALAPVFSALGNGIKAVWEWFKNLLTPMQTSKDTLDKCASAGETFGRVMGTALSVLLWPLQQLMNGVSWLLEKLDLIPDGIERARQQADKAQSALEASAAALAGHQLPLGQATVSGAGGGKPPVITGDNGTLRRLNNIADNTKATANNTKKIGPGDIVFKNLPRALALRGPYQERGLFRSLYRACPPLRPAAFCRCRRRRRGQRLRRSPRRQVLRRSSSWSLTTSVNARIRNWKKWCVTPCAMQWPAPAKLTVVHSAIGSKEVL